MDMGKQKHKITKKDQIKINGRRNEDEEKRGPVTDLDLPGTSAESDRNFDSEPRQERRMIRKRCGGDKPVNSPRKLNRKKSKKTHTVVFEENDEVVEMTTAAMATTFLSQDEGLTEEINKEKKERKMQTSQR